VGVAGQANPFGAQQMVSETMHLSLVSSISAAEAAPGKPVTLSFSVSPKRDMHVYAPGKHDYQVISVSVDPQPWMKLQPTVYPPSEIHDFKELNEKVEVYSKPFTLKRELTVLATPEARKAVAGKPSVQITGNVDYQACDEKVCYAPKKVPFKFTVDLAAK
jgi:hypothetical protein